MGGVSTPSTQRILSNNIARLFFGTQTKGKGKIFFLEQTASNFNMVVNIFGSGLWIAGQGGERKKT